MKIVERRFLKTSTRAVHAASIEFFQGHPVFAWFGGHKEGSPDTSVFVHNLFGKEDTVTVGSREYMAHWNPVLFSTGENTLYMFEKAGDFCDRWQTFLHDLGSWSIDATEKEIRYYRQILSAGLNGPVKTKPLVSGNRLICGSSVETVYDWTSYIEEYNIPSSGKLDINKEFIRRSKPLYVPEKVTYSDPLSGLSYKSLGIIQPTLWKNPVATYAFFRSSRGLNRIYYSTALDDFEWSDPQPTNLENPNSGIDCVRFKGRLFLAHNPSAEKRSPLVISELHLEKSEQEIVYFKTVDRITIADKVEASGNEISGELSYPYMVEKDGKLHLVYTYGRVKIEYVVIDIN